MKSRYRRAPATTRAQAQERRRAAQARTGREYLERAEEIEQRLAQGARDASAAAIRKARR